MPTSSSTITLLPEHSRFIDARAGLRLQVLSGCVWLTRPHDPVDHFLSAGVSIELHEDAVLIQSHVAPGAGATPAARCVLHALQASTPLAKAPRHGQACAS